MAVVTEQSPGLVVLGLRYFTGRSGLDRVLIRSDLGSLHALQVGRIWGLLHTLHADQVWVRSGPCWYGVGLVSQSVDRSVAGIRHSQLPGLSGYPSPRGLEASLLMVRVLFMILAIVAGQALVGAYGSGFNLCLASRP